MSWDIEYTDQFEVWWESLSEDEQEELEVAIRSLESLGPRLHRPFADLILTSRHHNMKELRQSTLRVLFALDPRQSAILLIGGDKSPNDPSSPNWNRWYERFVPIADDLYDEYLNELRREGRIK
jgi:hypothetical protein